MKYLLDTHTFLWYAKQEPILPDAIKELISDSGNDIKISIASFWEIAIKNSIGKLPLGSGIIGLETSAEDEGIEIIPITTRAVDIVTRLPQRHKDPFDRIIAATAITEGYQLLSADPIFDAYGVTRVWGS